MFSRRYRRSALFALGIISTILLSSSGCDEFVVVSVAPKTLTTGSGLFVVDCNTGKAYVPLLGQPDPATGNGRIAIVDLTVDPDQQDPRLSTIVLSHADDPTGTAMDLDDNLVVAVSGMSGAGGFVDLIDTTTDTLTSDSPIAMPAGMEPGSTGQVLYDPVGKMLIIAVTWNSSCTSGTCTGFVLFNPRTRKFSPVIESNYSETFAFDAAQSIVINASDDDNSGEIGIVDIAQRQTCLLSDPNIGSDSDGASVDFNTSIAVISNEDGTATVINLRGVAFSGSAPNCVATEPGTTPNSVLITGLPSDTAGSAVNPETHEAFLIEDGDDGITLLSLPSAPVKQLTANMIGVVTANIPSTPDGWSFDPQSDPYAVAIDVCNNVGYAVNDNFTWMVGVDLTRMRNNPSAIDTSLPSGSCAGTSRSCDNGKGVRFFPLPPFGPQA